MNLQEKEKRNGAFWAWLALWIITPTSGVLTQVGPPSPGSAFPWIISIVFLAALLFQIVLWFRVFFHWSRAKGHSGWFCIVAILGPVALIILPFLRDGGVTPEQPDDPIRQCPGCGADYKLGDYDLRAKRILCSQCKEELPS